MLVQLIFVLHIAACYFKEQHNNKAYQVGSAKCTYKQNWKSLKMHTTSKTWVKQSIYPVLLWTLLFNSEWHSLTLSAQLNALWLWLLCEGYMWCRLWIWLKRGVLKGSTAEWLRRQAKERQSYWHYMTNNHESHTAKFVCVSVCVKSSYI